MLFLIIAKSVTLIAKSVTLMFAIAWTILVVTNGLTGKYVDKKKVFWASYMWALFYTFSNIVI